MVYLCLCILVTQLCLTLCNSMDCSPPGSSVHGILQARILEWSHSLLQGIFPTQGSKVGFLPKSLQLDSLLSEPLGKPKTFGLTPRHEGSYFLNQRLNPQPLLWKIKSTTGPQGESQVFFFFSLICFPFPSLAAIMWRLPFKVKHTQSYCIRSTI